MASTDQCSKCKFFNPNEHTCHFEAPVPSRLAGENLTKETKWSPVRITDWCGRFVDGPYKGA